MVIMTQKGNKNNNPSDLGPWNLTKELSYDLNIHRKPEDFMISHVSPRLTIRLPRIGHHLDQTSRSKKLALKMSHQSLEFAQNL